MISSAAWWNGLLAASILFASACGGDGGSSPSENDASLQDAGAGDGGDIAESADGSSEEARALVHNALWRAVSAADDPFASEPSDCPADSYGEELLGGELVFFVRTEWCSPLTVRQSSRVALEAGERVHIRVYHFPLTAPEDGRAVLVLQIGDTEMWRGEFEIPSDAEDIGIEWSADQAYPMGTPIWFHVENHGANEYALVALEVP